MGNHRLASDELNLPLFPSRSAVTDCSAVADRPQKLAAVQGFLEPEMSSHVSVASIMS
jgi:hypothetical protein